MVFGLMGPAMMSFGVGVAIERETGLMTFRRALPMPPLGFLLSKLLGSVMFACVVLACMTLATVLLSHVELSAVQYVKLFGAGCLMVLPFCALGLVIGSSAPAAGAMALANLGWIGLAMLGGLMFPIPRSLAMWTPTYYAGQLGQGIVGMPTHTPVWLSLTVLGVLTVILGAVAVNRINMANEDR
jgi:ABC-2 type transport system permease protein